MNIWQGQKIRLRAVEPSDWQAHFAWNQDSEMPRDLDWVWFPQSQEAVKRWTEQASMHRPENDEFQFEIETLAGEYVGSINSHSCNRRVGTFSYGIAILPQHQRCGYASEAIRLLLRYFFQELRYQKVNAPVYSFNEPSIRLHEALGFQLEGQIRRMVYTQGQYFDELIFGLTAEEFAAKSSVE